MDLSEPHPFPLCAVSADPLPPVWKGEAIATCRAHISTHQHGENTADCLRAGMYFPKTQQKISAEWLHIEANAQTPVLTPTLSLSLPACPSPAVSLSPRLDVCPQKVAHEHLIYNASKTRNQYPFYSHVIPQWQPSRREYNVLPVSVLRKPFNSCMHCLANAVCFDGSLTVWPKQNSFYCPKIGPVLSFLHSQELAVTEFNNVKGTTHAKIDVIMELAAVAFVVKCSSLHTHYCWLGKGEQCRLLTSRGRPKLWKESQDVIRPTWPPSHFLRVSKITSPITFMAIGEI